MATSINFRINDKLEQKLKETVEELKKTSPLGAEVNASTVVRGALIEFLTKFEEREKEPWGYDMKTKQISARVDEQLLEEVNSIIEKFNRESTNGAMLDLASVVRYSLKKYVQEQKRQ